MSSFRFTGITSLLAAIVAPVAMAADSSVRLLQCVPAGAPGLLHVRDVNRVREDFSHTPIARMWGEPEVQAFFAPGIALLNSPETQVGFAKFEQATGLTPLEFFNLFSGELVLAVMLPPGAESMPEPHVVFGGALGGNRPKLEAALKKVGESPEATAVGSVVTEEFQGEMIHVTFDKGEDDDAPKEAVSWAFVDDVVWFGYPKVALQSMIAGFKQGGAAEPVTATEGFGPIYQRNPGAQVAYYLDLQRLVQIGLSVYQAQEATKQLAAAEDQDADAEPAKPSMVEQMGLTPEVIVHALGFDALRGLYGVSTGDKTQTSMTAGVTWTEQRGLLRMLAYGDAPAPEPAYVAPNWASVTSVRFKVPDILEAIKDAARTANPMFEFMIAQQLAALKQQLGVDVERDVFGSFGDEVVRAYSFPLGDATSTESNEQLWAISLANAESLTRTLDVVWTMAPQVAQQFQDRDYLGHTIRSITVPFPGPGGMTMMTISYAITPGHLFVDIGGAKMIETAIQRLDGKGESFWTQAPVNAAKKALPPGGSSFTYQDIHQVIHSACVQLADLARKSRETAGTNDEEPTLDEEGRPIISLEDDSDDSTRGLHMFIDPDAVPSRTTLEKYFGVSFGAIYRDADGIRFHARYNNAP